MSKAWHYSDGKWVLGDDPLMDAQAADLFSLGYKQRLSVGMRWQAGFDLYEREDGSALIMTGTGERFYVAAAPDARDICARWAALTRDKVIIDASMT